MLAEYKALHEIMQQAETPSMSVLDVPVRWGEENRRREQDIFGYALEKYQVGRRSRRSARKVMLFLLQNRAIGQAMGDFLWGSRGRGHRLGALIALDDKDLTAAVLNLVLDHGLEAEGSREASPRTHAVVPYRVFNDYISENRGTLMDSVIDRCQRKAVNDPCRRFILAVFAVEDMEYKRALRAFLFRPRPHGGKIAYVRLLERRDPELSKRALELGESMLDQKLVCPRFSPEQEQATDEHFELLTEQKVKLAAYGEKYLERAGWGTLWSYTFGLPIQLNAATRGMQLAELTAALNRAAERYQNPTLYYSRVKERLEDYGFSAKTDYDYWHLGHGAGQLLGAAAMFCQRYEQYLKQQAGTNSLSEAMDCHEEKMDEIKAVLGGRKHEELERKVEKLTRDFKKSRYDGERKDREIVDLQERLLRLEAHLDLPPVSRSASAHNNANQSHRISNVNASSRGLPEQEVLGSSPAHPGNVRSALYGRTPVMQEEIPVMASDAEAGNAFSS